MNVFNKVTLESLKKNRTRTIVTIIGIMLSAAMICASTTLVSSMQNFVLRCAIHIDGDWYGAVYDAAYKDYEDIRDSDRVSSAAYAQVLGYAKIDSANERKPYLYVLGGDVASGYFKTMPVHLILGTLPKDSTEIILPEHLTSNGKVNYKLGDTVTLDVGDRTLDGRRLGQDTPVYTYDSETQVEIMSGERLENTEPRTYTVVGIYERPTFEDYSAPGYTALTAADTKSADQAPIHCYFKLHKPAGVYDFMKEKGYTQEYRYAYNTKVLLYSGTAPFDSFLTAFYSLAAIIIALIVFGVAFILVENAHKGKPARINALTELTYPTVFMIGMFQLIAAVFPGTSRSGATIVGALLLGVSRTVAAEFTFFLAIPVMFGASLLKILKFGFAFTSTELMILGIGTITAFVSSLLIIRFLMGFVKKHDFKVFGWYRIILGIAVLAHFMLAK